MSLLQGMMFYPTQLKEHLKNIELTANELAREEQTKSIEQFKAKVAFVIMLLKEADAMVD